MRISDATENMSRLTRGPLSESREQRVVTLAWSDSRGRHEHSISALTTLGTSPAATLVLDDPSVSRVHAR